MIKRIVLFGDSYGIPQLVKHIPPERIEAVVIASIREKECENIREFAGVFGCPLLVQPLKEDRITMANFVLKLKMLEPDLIFTHSYSMYIPQFVLDKSRYGAINIHYALLPKYRGANPIQWAIINGEHNTGVTLHYMNERIDAGDIIAQKEVEIEFTDTWIDVRKKCNDITDELLSEEIPKILSGTNSRTVQDESQSTTFRRRTKDDGEFTWKESPIDIYNKIRALVKPHPGAFYYDWGGRRIIIDTIVPYYWVQRKKEEMWGY